jgi:hypothetical protein
MRKFMWQDKLVQVAQFIKDSLEQVHNGFQAQDI